MKETVELRDLRFTRPTLEAPFVKIVQALVMVETAWSAVELGCPIF